MPPLKIEKETVQKDETARGLESKQHPSRSNENALERKKQSFEYLWRSGIAGGLAGCVAKTTVAPLDRVKILFQSNNPLFADYSGSLFGFHRAFRDIHHREGLLGLFRGHSATILRIFPSASIRFLSYEQIRAILITNPAQETSFRRLISGSLAGATSVFFTYPLDVIRVRLAFETRQHSNPTLASICKQIYYEPAPFKPATSCLTNVSATMQSVPLVSMRALTTIAIHSVAKLRITNFYRGFTPTLLGILPYAGMSFLTYDTMRDIMHSPAVERWTCLPQSENSPTSKPAPLRPWAQLTAGGITGLIAQSTSYPLEVIRRRMQVNGAIGDKRLLSIRGTARLIAKEKGVLGFFVGLNISAVKIVPLFAVNFLAYEQFKSWFGI